MHVYKCVCVDACLCGLIWGKPEVDTGCLSLSFFALAFESGSLSGTVACWFSKAGCRTPVILSLSPQCWDYRCAATSGCFKRQNILWIVILCQRYSWQIFSPIFGASLPGVLKYFGFIKSHLSILGQMESYSGSPFPHLYHVGYCPVFIQLFQDSCLDF